ncbi:glutaminyl-peptide cyclotransferase [Aethina tumida]|uniref:glutaminyl-peptide cyclotransferase n=1 Tax=Aethina tumida TaxID=116153 RepID=UPI0021481F6C|nr:glutaminyl-peptide cyclotransferase [Aethina tumida]XP_049817132.1 glutaminyl-peptide cyclotransferase [Aethina tumida]
MMLKTFNFLLFVSAIRPGVCDYLRKLQANHKAQDLSNQDLQYVSSMSNTNHLDEVLDNILIPRVVGTKNHQKVHDYIKSDLRRLNWTVEVDEFQDATPNFGVLTFRNIIAKLNPNAERYLTLACHYDSKYFPNDEFVGATDSAVPCAMLLNIAHLMRRDLDAQRSNELSLQLIFFDGEEAFENWGPKDSIYGARHLAEMFNDARSISTVANQEVTNLQKIDMLVLLDLIGHRDVSFYSYFHDTQQWYIRLANLEDRLRKLRLLKKTGNHVYFKRAAHWGRIEDDHLPFLERGVPILHLISSPFPREWHTPRDNRDIVDMNATENIQKILMAFVVEYLHIALETERDTNIEREEL